MRPGLPRTPDGASFLLALVVTSLGWGMYGPVSLLYFHLVAGLDLPVVGVALSAATLLAFPVPVLAGVLVDRYGARRVVVAGELLQGLGYVGYLAVTPTGPIALVAAALVVAFGQRLYWSSYFSLVADIAPAPERDRWYGLGGAAQAAGVGAGGLLLGLLVATTGTAAYSVGVAANGVSSLLAAVLLLARLRDPLRTHVAGASSGGYGVVFSDRPFVWLIVSNVAFAVCSMMLAIGLPVYVVEALGAPGWVVGALFALNTALIAGVQTTVVRLLGPYRRTRVWMFAGLVWAVWCGLLGLGLLVPRELLVAYLFGVMGVYALAELVHAPTSSALSAAASPEGLRGRYLATFQFSWSIASVVTPGLFTLLYATRPVRASLAVGALVSAASAAVYRLEPHLPPEAIRRPT